MDYVIRDCLGIGRGLFNFLTGSGSHLAKKERVSSCLAARPFCLEVPRRVGGPAASLPTSACAWVFSACRSASAASRPGRLRNGLFLADFSGRTPGHIICAEKLCLFS